jgi:hypothetical protein
VAPEQTNATPSNVPAAPQQVPQAAPAVLETVQQTAAAPTAQPVGAQPAPDPSAFPKLLLPATVVSRADIGHSLRELERLDDFFHQASIRGTEAQALPKLGYALEAIATVNKLNLLHGEERAKLKTFLATLKTHAPVVHMGFPSEASRDFLAKLLEWFRTETHPYVLLHVGLQPELAAGCTVRTTNKMFDFSFRKRFERSKQMLIAALEANA